MSATQNNLNSQAVTGDRAGEKEDNAETMEGKRVVQVVNDVVWVRYTYYRERFLSGT